MMAFCGLNCSGCSNYKSTLELDFDDLAREAKKWSDDKHAYSEIDMLCLGCNRDNASVMFPFCKDCAVRPCAARRKVLNCAECEEFDTCGKINKLLNSFSDTKVRRMMTLMHRKVVGSRRGAASAPGHIG